MIKGIIFDFDGTLFDSMFLWQNLASDYLRSIGKEPSLSLIKQIESKTFEQACYFIKQTYYLRQSEEQIQKGMQQTLKQGYAKKIKPKPGVISFLHQLKQQGIFCVIASSTNKEWIELALKHYQLENYFEKIYTCDALKINKDQPLFYELVLKDMNLNKEEVLIFEDAYYAIMSAKKACFKVIGVKDDYETQNIQPFVDYYIDHDFKELKWEEL